MKVLQVKMYPIYGTAYYSATATYKGKHEFFPPEFRSAVALSEWVKAKAFEFGFTHIRYSTGEIEDLQPPKTPVTLPQC